MKQLLLVSLFVITSAVSALEQGEMAPSVELTSMGDQPQTINIIEPSEGKSYVVMEFMSITCGPCIKSLPFLRLLNNEIKGNADLRMVDIDRPSDDVNAFFNDYYSPNFDLPFFGDTEQRAAARAFMIKYTPTLFVVDSEGLVVYKHIGTIDLASANEIAEIINN